MVELAATLTVTLPIALAHEQLRAVVNETELASVQTTLRAAPPAREPIWIKRQKATRAKLASGQAVILGVRPEHISAKPGGDSFQKVNARIEVTEPVGNEIFVYFKLEQSNEQFVSRVPADVHPTAGSTFPLYVDVSKLHFFDRSTERALT